MDEDFTRCGTGRREIINGNVLVPDIMVYLFPLFDPVEDGCFVETGTCQDL